MNSAPAMNPYDQARLDVCNVVEALTGQATRLEFTHVHDQRHMCLALLEVGLEIAKEIEPELRGLMRARVSAVADEVAFVTAALHPADLAVDRRTE